MRREHQRNTRRPVPLPPGLSEDTYDQLHQLRFDSDACLFLADFFTLVETVLRRNDPVKP